MRVIALRRLRQFWQSGHADAEGSLRAWFRSVERADWSKFADLRRDFPRADLVGEKTVFDLCGNKFRLITRVDYVRKGVLIIWVGTHAEYDCLRIDEL